jgi:uncharacterized membrane protein YsdA (DUF1294 family)
MWLIALVLIYFSPAFVMMYKHHKTNSTKHFNYLVVLLLAGVMLTLVTLVTILFLLIKKSKQ